jgi:dTDP-4-dehydrorhamnose reductase
MISLASENKPLSVVTDEVASPTYLDDLAPAIASLLGTDEYGTYHLVNEGAASRYDFARQILDCSGFEGYPIQPIKLTDFKRPSRPPKYTPLRNFLGAQIGLKLRPWQEAVAAFAEHERLANSRTPIRTESP